MECGMTSRRDSASLQQAQQLLERGQIEAAEKLLRKLVRRDKRLAEGHALLGRIASRQARHDDSRQHYLQALRSEPDSSRYAFLVAWAYSALGRASEAIEYYDRALLRDPDNKDILGRKAITLELVGNATEALEIVEPFIEATEETSEMAVAYVLSKQRLQQHREAIRIAERWAAEEMGLAIPERVAFTYYAAKSKEKLGDYDAAFESYCLANKVGARPISRDAIRRPIDALIEVFSPDLVPGFAQAANSSIRPVFIVGMPRSGTTLIEQIVDAHPQAFGLGEITDIEQIATQLGGQPSGGVGFPPVRAAAFRADTDRRRSPIPASRAEARRQRLPGREQEPLQLDQSRADPAVVPPVPSSLIVAAIRSTPAPPAS